MLSFEITYKDGRKMLLKHVLTAEMKCDLDVPADSLTLTCVYQKELAENADFISAYRGGDLVFHGQLDELVSLKQGGGIINKLTARSLAAGLLDNEAEPLDYNNPSAQFIFDRHLYPFGISEYIGDKLPFFGRLRIDKGMSHWQVLETFCRNRYGSMPRITADGTAYLAGLPNGKTVMFGKEGVPYYSIKECVNRHKLISKVMLRLGVASGYRSVLENPNEECQYIHRVRYVNALADNSTVDTAHKILEQSSLNSYSVKLKCVGCHIDLLGCEAVIHDDLFRVIEELKVSGVNYTLSSGGERTTFVLRKEKC